MSDLLTTIFYRANTQAFKFGQNIKLGNGFNPDIERKKEQNLKCSQTGGVLYLIQQTIICPNFGMPCL